MAMIPGINGQKTELFDGAKIDAISEYTAGNGVQLQGRTNGVAIEAGKPGETVSGSVSISCASIASSGSWGNAITQAMKAGKWLVFAAIGNLTGGVTVSHLCISDSGHNSGAIPVDAVMGGLNCDPMNSDGVNYRQLSGVEFNKAGDWTLYISANTIYTSATMRVQFRAVRIA